MRDLDVTLYGATGFVGRLTARYLAQHAPESTRIGLAGRSEQRLEEVRRELGVDWPVIVADSGDEAALRALAERSEAVATTVGPYAKYGRMLVAACAEAGTHYADLTGETSFMREVIDAHDARAKETGARIVHNCGFDSIPSDLGVQLLRQIAQEPLEDTTAVFTVRGGISGGTLDSMRGQLDEARSDKSRARTMMDPYALSPARDREPDLGAERELMRPDHDSEVGWIAPWVMATINTRVVRRSNALQDWAYGRRFKYREVMRANPVVGTAVTAGLGTLVAGLSFPPTRKLLDKVLPKPGEGPSEKTQNSGFFKVDIHAQGESGRRYRAKVAAKGDPGYAATAVMFGEAALCLALDELPGGGGVLTPATAMGAVLAERLRRAGMTLEAAAV